MMPTINNPVGISGLALAFLTAITGLIAITTEIAAETVGAINLVIATGVALVAEIVRRK